MFHIGEDIVVYFVLHITYLGKLTKYAVGSTQYGHFLNSFETHPVLFDYDPNHTARVLEEYKRIVRRLQTFCKCFISGLLHIYKTIRVSRESQTEDNPPPTHIFCIQYK